MLHKRYTDNTKLISNADELQLTNQTEVVIYRKDKWQDEIIVDLEEQAENFEQLKPYIAYIAQNLSNMDCMVQKYSKEPKFAFDFILAYVYMDLSNHIILEYWGTTVNTTFQVIFEQANGKFHLKKCGTKIISQPYHFQCKTIFVIFIVFLLFLCYIIHK